MKEPTRTAAKPTKVATTTVGPATFKEQLVNSPQQQQPTDICSVCGGRHHSQTCNVLEAIPVADDRVKKLAEKRLCFHCFGQAHSARDCKDKPTCGKCGQKHATLLHERTQFKGRGREPIDGLRYKTADPAALAAAAAAAHSVAPSSNVPSTTSSTSAEPKPQEA